MKGESDKEQRERARNKQKRIKEKREEKPFEA